MACNLVNSIHASCTDFTVLQMMLQVIWPVYIMSKVNWTWQFYTTNKLLHVTPDFWKLTIIWLVFFFFFCCLVENAEGFVLEIFLYSVLIIKRPLCFLSFKFCIRNIFF